MRPGQQTQAAFMTYGFGNASMTMSSMASGERKAASKNGRTGD